LEKWDQLSIHYNLYKGEYEFFRVHADVGLGIMYRRNHFIDDLKFSTVKCKGLAYNLFTWPKRFTKDHFPSAVSLAKSLLGRA
jgi:hypothetical protein